jgi:PEP-CTERM motif-containing protein
VVKDIYVGAFLGNAGLSYVNQTFQTAVPEPASLALLGTGLLGLSFVGRRKRPEAA